MSPHSLLIALIAAVKARSSRPGNLVRALARWEVAGFPIHAPDAER